MPDYNKYGFKNKDVDRIIKNDTLQKTKKEPKVPIRSKSGGTLEIRRSTYEDAKNKRNYFKPWPEFKGKLMKSDKSNRVYGYVKHDKTFIPATNPTDRRKIIEQYEYDKKLYEYRSAQHDSVTKSMSTIYEKENKKK